MCNSNRESSGYSNSDSHGDSLVTSISLSIYSAHRYCYVTVLPIVISMVYSVVFAK